MNIFLTTLRMSALVFSMLAFSGEAFAQYSFRINPPGKFTEFMDLVNVLVEYAYRVAIPIAVLVIIYAGAKFLLARGDASAVGEAKQILWWGIVGLAIVIIGSGFIALINSILGVG